MNFIQVSGCLARYRLIVDTKRTFQIQNKKGGMLRVLKIFLKTRKVIHNKNLKSTLAQIFKYRLVPRKTDIKNIHEFIII